MNLFDELFDKLFGLFFGFILLVVIGGIVYVIYAFMFKTTITLPATEWHCVSTQPHRVVTYIKSGDVLVPIENVVDECVEYRRNY